MCDEALGRFIHELLDERGLNIVKHGAVVARTRLREAVDRLIQKRDQLQAWVNDLQASMYINCVYCGHRYGPDTKVPESMAEVLKQHIEKCPDHPMSKIKEHCEGLEQAVKETILAIEAGEKQHTSDSTDALLQGYRQRFGVTFLDMLKGSLKGGYHQRALDMLKERNERLQELNTRYKERYERAEQINEELVRGLENAGETMRMIRGRCDVSSLQTKKKAEEDWLPVIYNLSTSGQEAIKRLLEEDRS